MLEALGELGAFPAYALGWLAGTVARMGAWLRDAFIAGYRDGRGIEYGDSTED